ncbi:MAG: hypothetical protein ABJP66_04355 [Hyphomicrobiales bacterium]
MLSIIIMAEATAVTFLGRDECVGLEPDKSLLRSTNALAILASTNIVFVRGVSVLYP